MANFELPLGDELFRDRARVFGEFLDDEVSCAREVLADERSR